MKLKRFIISFLLLILIFACTINVSAENKIYNWYCKRTSDHSQPPLPNEFEFINNYEGYYIDNNDSEKVIYLTFDAGYENGNIAKTLDVLKNNNVTSAFFILSNLIKSNPELVKRMAEDGHLVCNHTATHKDMSKVKNFENFKEELEKLETDYRFTTGREVAKYFRPPEGRFTEETLNFANQLGYKTIFWSFAYADWDNNKQMSCDAAKKKIMDNIHNGAVILLHPTSETNAQILNDIIIELKQMGYRFASLDELTKIGR